jgi:Phospholipase_D-nuclease N-terminal
LAYMVPVVLAVAMMVLWIVALVDVLQRADSEFPNHQPGSSDKVVWVLVVVLLNGIGALAYYFMVMKPYPRPRR